MKRALIHPAADSFDLVCEDIAPDKSISHRCAMFSLLSDKPSRIRNFLEGEDTLNSLHIAEQLGAVIEKENDELLVTPPSVRRRQCWGKRTMCSIAAMQERECGSTAASCLAWRAYLY